jgi:hypothetical protein
MLVSSVSGNKWIPFNIGNQSPGPWYVWRNKPNGQDLGKVDIALYPNATGSVRNNNNQYYLDRILQFIQLIRQPEMLALDYILQMQKLIH